MVHSLASRMSHSRSLSSSSTLPSASRIPSPFPMISESVGMGGSKCSWCGSRNLGTSTVASALPSRIACLSSLVQGSAR